MTLKCARCGTEAAAIGEATLPDDGWKITGPNTGRCPICANGERARSGIDSVRSRGMLSDDDAPTSKVDPADLSDLHMVLLGLLRFDLAATVAGLAEMMRLTEPEVQAMLDELEAAGLVEAEGEQ